MRRSAQGKDAHGGASITDAWGVRTKAAPGGPGRPIGSIEVREIVAGDGASSEPARRLSGGTCSGCCTGSCAARRRQRRRRCPHLCGHDCPALLRSEVRARSAGARARAESAMRRVVGEPVDGEAGTGGARRAAAPSRGDARSRGTRLGRARRGPRRARRAAPSRGVHDGHRHKAVEPRQERVAPATAVSAASRRAKRSAQRPKGAEARGIAAEIGAKRRLQRKARSRSDAPRFIVCIRESVSIFGTVITITVCTIGFTGTIGAGIVVNSTGTVACRDARLMSGRA